MIQTLRKAYQRWSKDDGSLLAAAVAYYLALAFFPLLLVLLSGLGFFFQWSQSGQDAESQLLSTIEEQLSPTLSEQVKTVFAQVRDRASIGGPVGLITLLATSLLLFTQIDTAFDRIWNTPSPKRSWWGLMLHVVLKRARAFLMLMALGGIVIAVFLSGTFLTTMTSVTGGLAENPWVQWALELVLSFGLNCLVFACLYRFVPRHAVPWKAAAAGGLCAAVIWELGRIALTAIVIGKTYSAYGVLGAFLAIMLWAYYAMCVIFFGAEFTQVISEQSDSNAAET